MKTLKDITLSKQARHLVRWVENPVPMVRQWHRFAYEEHFFRTSKWDRIFNGVFSTFEATQKAIPNHLDTGYDNPAAATYLGQKASILSSDYPILFWLDQLLKECNQVFDFGGYLGLSFRAYSDKLRFSDSLRWCIYDVPAVVSAGIEILKTSPCPQLSFTADFTRAADADILLASGSLQYCKRTLADYLSELTSLPKHILINKLPLTSGQEFVTLQNMGPAVSPYRIFQDSKFINSLETLGYRLIDRWKNDDFGCMIPFDLERSVPAFSGLYFSWSPPDA